MHQSLRRQNRQIIARFELHSIYPSGPSISSAASPGFCQDIFAVELVVQGVEPIVRVFPSLWHATFLAVPRALSEVVGLRHSRLFRHSSRRLGTEAPSLPARYSVLCYYGPLRLPLSPLRPLAGLALGPCLPMSAGLPCSYEFPVCSCRHHYSGGLPQGLFRSLRPVSLDQGLALGMPAFAQNQRARRPHCPFRSLLDVHSRYGLFTP
jgi:hypothetical protein